MIALSLLRVTLPKIASHWIGNSDVLQVLNLVEHLCIALNDEFRIFLPEILPRCVQVLSDAERSGDYTYVPPVLHTFEVFGGKHCQNFMLRFWKCLHCEYISIYQGS